MKKTRKKETALPLAQAIIKGIQEKKGQEIVCLDLTKINRTICDYFIICHGDSHRQVQAISDSIIKEVQKTTGEKPWHSEGIQNSEWVLMDYVNVVAHVFLKEMRGFYNLEGLWADAEIIKIPENSILKIKDEKKRTYKKGSALVRKKREKSGILKNKKVSSKR